MKKKILLILFVLIAIIIITFIFNFKNHLINPISKSKKETISTSIILHSNKNNIYQLLITFYDENGIETITIPNTDYQISGYGKNKISIDYSAKFNEEYTFHIKSQNNNTIDKKILINQDFIDNILKIDYDNSLTQKTSLDISILSPSSYFYITQYKIGENGTWQNYSKPFSINSYDILNKKLYNSDKSTITIYAKGLDKDKNEVLISKDITNLDLDIPSAPSITVLDVDDYPILTDKGILLNSNISINYDSKEDITNYYSLDNGNTWNIYTGTITSNKPLILAKSVKKESGLYSQSKLLVNARAKNAIHSEWYDSNINTSKYIDGTRILNVDKSAIGKTIQFLITGYSSDNWQCTIYFYDKNSSLLLKTSNNWLQSSKNVIVPENCTQIKFKGTYDFTFGSGIHFQEIKLLSD